MSDETISVIVPVFNQAPYLKRSLGALARQSRPPAEVIVVDDGSTDGSGEVARGFASQFDASTNYLVLGGTKNAGVIAATNLALSHVRSEWTYCGAADDWVEQHFVERMTEAMRISPVQGIITSQYVEWFEREDHKVYHNHRSELGSWYQREAMHAYTSEEYDTLIAKGHVSLQLNCSILRTNALKQSGGFDPRLKWHTDWFAATDIALRHGFSSISEPLAVFRRAEGTYSANVNNRELQRELFASLFDKLKSSEFARFRRAARERPAIFAPFARDVLSVLARRKEDRDLFFAVLYWWLCEVAALRRPGPLLELKKSMGMGVTPKN